VKEFRRPRNQAAALLLVVAASWFPWACGDAFTAGLADNTRSDASGTDGRGGDGGSAAPPEDAQTADAVSPEDAPITDDAAAGTAGVGSSGSGGRTDGSGGRTDGSGGFNGIDAARDSSAPFDAATDPVDPALPTQGLLLWLRADRGVTLEEGRVSEWADQSAQRASAFQQMPELRPRLSSGAGFDRPTLEFDGTDDYLSLPAGFADFSAGATLFGVFEASALSSCAAAIELSNGREQDDISLGQYMGRIYYEAFQLNVFGDSLPVGVAWEVTAVHQPTQLAELRRNGTTNTMFSGFLLPATITRAQNFIGRSLYDGCAPFGGRIAELLVYQRALSPAEVAAIEATLQARWNCCGGGA
jgi:hypothetical protein